MLGTTAHAAQRKAIIAPFEEFGAKPEDVLQHISRFTQWCEETGMVEDFSSIEHENPPPSDIDMTDSTDGLLIPNTSNLEHSHWLFYHNYAENPSHLQ